MMKLARSTYYYRARRAAAREKALHERIVSLCEVYNLRLPLTVDG
jgi:hypothetical protein